MYELNPSRNEKVMIVKAKIKKNMTRSNNCQGHIKITQYIGLVISVGLSKDQSNP